MSAILVVVAIAACSAVAASQVRLSRPHVVFATIY